MLRLCRLPRLPRWMGVWTASMKASRFQLDHEDQYRRTEEPYPGAEEFSATALANWTDEGLYLAVEVVKPEVLARDPTHSAPSTGQRA